MIRYRTQQRVLSPNDVKIWFEHLQTENRRRAQKAAATWRKKIEKQSFHDVHFCGVCHDRYMDFTDEQEDWIECEGCPDVISFHMYRNSTSSSATDLLL